MSRQMIQNPFRTTLILGLTILAQNSFVLANAPKLKPNNSITLSKCHLTSPGLAVRLEAKCGFVEVPENWTKPQGSKIKIKVAVSAADTNRPLSDPLFFLAGGPGQSATESYISVSPAFRWIGRQRDIVLIDQRGTGQSNPLRCEFPTHIGFMLNPNEFALKPWLKKCIQSLSVDLKQYTTLSFVKDLDYIRQRLGYKKINLYAISYGTRVALSFLREFPDSIRRIVLDGVMPPELAATDVLSEAPKRAKNILLRQCAKDKTCAESFPYLDKQIRWIENWLITNAPNIEINHPRTGKPVKIKFTIEQWGMTLRIMAYSSETISLIPMLIDDAFKQKDLSKLVAQSIIVGESLTQIISNGLEYSVICSEDWPYQRKTGKPTTNPFGRQALGQVDDICEIWPHQVVTSNFKTPVISDVPTLLLSGKNDPVTPPDYANQVAFHLSKSHHVIIPGHGHMVIGRGCVPKKVTEFLNTEQTQNLDFSCVQKIQGSGFFIDFSGPKP